MSQSTKPNSTKRESFGEPQSPKNTQAKKWNNKQDRQAFSRNQAPFFFFGQKAPFFKVKILRLPYLLLQMRSEILYLSVSLSVPARSRPIRLYLALTLLFYAPHVFSFFSEWYPNHPDFRSLFFYWIYLFSAMTHPRNIFGINYINCTIHTKEPSYIHFYLLLAHCEVKSTHFL